MNLLNESTVEDAALEWFDELGCAVGQGAQLAPRRLIAKQDGVVIIESNCLALMFSILLHLFSI